MREFICCCLLLLIVCLPQKIITPFHIVGGKIDKLKLRLSSRFVFETFPGISKFLIRLNFSCSSRSSSTASIGGIDNADSGHGPLKAKGKMSFRKASTENLLDDKKPAGPVRASSLEDIHALTTKSQGVSSGKGISEKIVDSVVKLYQPDHTHKYIDITPVSQKSS